MEFVFAAQLYGRKLPALKVVDSFTREALAIDVQSGIKGEQVVETISPYLAFHL